MLTALGAGGKAAFYEGEPARAIAAAVQAEGGLLTEADLAAHASEFDQALSMEYHGVELWETPPNGQGMTALIAANILNGARPPHGRTGRHPTPPAAGPSLPLPLPPWPSGSPS
eukprot:SAG22_NODE_4985_length_1115_cov_1.418307_2_plen_114_part_00